MDPHANGGGPPTNDLDSAGGDGETPFAMVAQFFLIPLAVVILAVGIFLLFGALSGGDQAPAELLTEVRTGSLNRRWQAAYQLAAEFKKKPGLAEDETLFRATLVTLEQAREPEVKRYLVLTLGRFDRPEAGPPLIAALDGDDEETRLYAALALASLRDEQAVPRLTVMLRDEAPSLRKAAAFALGHIGTHSAASAMHTTADDRHFDVALQAAVALAQLDDPYGLPVLRRGLDRSVLEALAETDPERSMNAVQQAEAMLDAIHAVALLGDESSRATLEAVARSDDDLRVRDAARRALATLGGAS